jgi:putative ABC transport system permease protein
VALVNGIYPGSALILGMGGGALAGAFTALLHTRVGVNRLLSGMITMTILHSVTLRTMGRSNTSLAGIGVVFDLFSVGLMRVFAGVALELIVALLLFMLLRTDLGHFIRAAGENPKVVVRRGYTE